MLYKGPTPKTNLSINGVDILSMDPVEVRQYIASLPKNERKLVRALVRAQIVPPRGRCSVPDDYAKEYGRPSIKQVSYMQSENDGMPYLGNGHAPNCDGTLTYYATIYDKRNGLPPICWCMWVSKNSPARYGTNGHKKHLLWQEYDKKKNR